jgi:hypothetical protein
MEDLNFLSTEEEQQWLQQKEERMVVRIRQREERAAERRREDEAAGLIDTGVDNGGLTGIELVALTRNPLTDSFNQRILFSVGERVEITKVGTQTGKQGGWAPSVASVVDPYIA